MLRAHLGAFTDERARPDPFVFREHLHTLRRTLVAAVEVVALGQGSGRRSDEVLVDPVDGARRVTQHAVDAHAVLLVVFQLLGCLSVFAFGQRLFPLTHDPRLDAHQLSHEVAEVDDQVADDWKVSQRLDADGSRCVLGEKRRARQLRLSIDGHAAAAAYAHPAGPSERQRAIQPVLDVVQSVEDDPILLAGNLVLVEGRPSFFLRTVAGNLQLNAIRHAVLSPHRPARPGASE